MPSLDVVGWSSDTDILGVVAVVVVVGVEVGTCIGVVIEYLRICDRSGQVSRRSTLTSFCSPGIYEIVNFLDN